MVLLALLALASAGARAAGDPQLIPQNQVFYSWEAGEAQAVVAPNTAALVGPPLGADLTGVATAEACSALCRADPECSWFFHCPLPVSCFPRLSPRRGAASSASRLLTPRRRRPPQDGCADGSGAAMAYHGCRLLASNCTLPVAGLHGAGVQITSGFPLRDERFPSHMLYTTVEGQGVAGGDIPCPTYTSVPGLCAQASVEDALVLCYLNAPTCKSVVVYAQGEWAAGAVGACGRPAQGQTVAGLLIDGPDGLVPPAPPARCRLAAHRAALAAPRPRRLLRRPRGGAQGVGADA